MEKQISISTFGNCVTRDIFRVSDQTHKFKLTGNIGFISPLSVNAPYLENTEDIQEKIEKCDDSGFNKRCRIQDFRKNAIEYLRKNKGEWLILDLSEVRLEIMRKGDFIYTYRKNFCNTERVAERELKSRGFNSVESSEISMDEMLEATENLCRKLMEIWPSDKILLLEDKPTNVLLTKDGFIEKNNPFLDSNYNNKSLWWRIQRINDKAALTLQECIKIEMPPMQYVTADQSHLFGMNALHYTGKVYDYLYYKICGKTDPSADKTLIFKAETELKNEYYQKYRIEKIVDSGISEQCLLLAGVNEILDYLTLLRSLRNCVIIISVKDTAGGALNYEIQSRLYDLGLSENLIKKYMVGYIAVSRNKMPVFEKITDQNGSLNEVIQVDYLNLNIISKPYLSGNRAEICINGVDYAVNKRGLNIVVYDYAAGKVVDSVAFDTHAAGCPCTRKPGLLNNEEKIRVDIAKLIRKKKGN